tara:strand:+ start:78 stop:806 length:729 start_codon:yes stop_codon:yes gene_type:complete
LILSRLPLSQLESNQLDGFVRTLSGQQQTVWKDAVAYEVTKRKNKPTPADCLKALGHVVKGSGTNAFGAELFTVLACIERHTSSSNYRWDPALSLLVLYWVSPVGVHDPVAGLGLQSSDGYRLGRLGYGFCFPRVVVRQALRSDALCVTQAKDAYDWLGRHGVVIKEVELLLVYLVQALGQADRADWLSCGPLKNLLFLLAQIDAVKVCGKLNAQAKADVLGIEEPLREAPVVLHQPKVFHL